MNQNIVFHKHFLSFFPCRCSWVFHKQNSSTNKTLISFRPWAWNQDLGRLTHHHGHLRKQTGMQPFLTSQKPLLSRICQVRVWLSSRYLPQKQLEKCLYDFDFQGFRIVWWGFVPTGSCLKLLATWVIAWLDLHFHRVHRSKEQRKHWSIHHLQSHSFSRFATSMATPVFGEGEHKIKGWTAATASNSSRTSYIGKSLIATYMCRYIYIVLFWYIYIHMFTAFTYIYIFTIYIYVYTVYTCTHGYATVYRCVCIYIHIYIEHPSTLHDSPSFPLAQVAEASFLSQIGPNPWFLMAFGVNLENST